jgi:hypothetical protein
MALLIDALYVMREALKLVYVVLTSPFAIVAGLLMLGNNNF